MFTMKSVSRGQGAQGGEYPPSSYSCQPWYHIPESLLVNSHKENGLKIRRGRWGSRPIVGLMQWFCTASSNILKTLGSFLFPIPRLQDQEHQAIPDLPDNTLDFFDNVVLTADRVALGDELVLQLHLRDALLGVNHTNHSELTLSHVWQQRLHDPCADVAGDLHGHTNDLKSKI